MNGGKEWNINEILRLLCDSAHSTISRVFVVHWIYIKRDMSKINSQMNEVSSCKPNRSRKCYRTIYYFSLDRRIICLGRAMLNDATQHIWWKKKQLCVPLIKAACNEKYTFELVVMMWKNEIVAHSIRIPYNICYSTFLHPAIIEHGISKNFFGLKLFRLSLAIYPLMRSED